MFRQILAQITSFIRRVSSSILAPKKTPAMPSEIIIDIETEEAKKEAEKKRRRFWRRFDRINNNICKALWRVFWIGVLLHVAEYFYPEISTKVPVIYTLYDYLMQLLNFLIWTTCKGLYSLFTGTYWSFCHNEWSTALKEGWNSFVYWISTL